MSHGTHPTPRTILTVVGLGLALLIGLSAAPPKQGIYNDWDDLHLTSDSDDNVTLGTGKVCQLCHRDDSGGNPWNAYGWEIREGMDSGLSEVEAILAAGSADSDGDPGGSTNEEEIAANAQPGWTPGPNNTIYFSNGSTVTNQLPPSGILGDLDPGTVVGTWTDLGQALAGTLGTPVLDGEGDLIGGTPITLTLTGALPASTAYLVVGAALLNAPFKGGVLVPDPNPPGFFVLLPTGGGTLPLADTWPAGLPSGFSLAFQYWIVDAGGPVGFAASNALLATTP